MTPPPAQCKVVLTCNQAVRGGRAVDLKATVDAAIRTCPSVQHVFVAQRTSSPAPRGDLDVPLEEVSDFDGCSIDVVVSASRGGS